jgi:hypothetical protein
VKYLDVNLHEKLTRRENVNQRIRKAYPSFWLCSRTISKICNGFKVLPVVTMKGHHTSDDSTHHDDKFYDYVCGNYVVARNLSG